MSTILFIYVIPAMLKTLTLGGYLLDVAGTIMRRVMFIGGCVELADEIMEERKEIKRERNKTKQPIEKACNSIMHTLWVIVYNYMMIALTGGLWIFWLIYKTVKKRNRKRA